MKTAIIAGTSESVELIKAAQDSFDITAFAATDYGGEILNGLKCKISIGRLNRQDFYAALRGFSVVVDASHPFAQEVSENVKSACMELDIPYLRMGRERLFYDYSEISYVSSKEQAAELLNRSNGNILFTTGVNTLRFYSENVRDFSLRSYARILDTVDSRRIAENLRATLIYGFPPFSENDTFELIRKHNIETLVSKDSGKRGGIPEKLSAAKKSGIRVILISSPESGKVNTVGEIISLITEIKDGMQ
ncbi:MAG: precorrin-6A reductase [Oscillospiraceae bacterium]|nr:precorrin-6A reductase [Oscillospiraceae bacterium]